jgi:hypothetical protein
MNRLRLIVLSGLISPRLKGYQEILLLKERLNPSRIQEKEVRIVEVA